MKWEQKIAQIWTSRIKLLKGMVVVVGALAAIATIIQFWTWWQKKPHQNSEKIDIIVEKFRNNTEIQESIRDAKKLAQGTRTMHGKTYEDFFKSIGDPRSNAIIDFYDHLWSCVNDGTCTGLRLREELCLPSFNFKCNLEAAFSPFNISNEIHQKGWMKLKWEEYVSHCSNYSNSGVKTDSCSFDSSNMIFPGLTKEEFDNMDHQVIVVPSTNEDFGGPYKEQATMVTVGQSITDNIDSSDKDYFLLDLVKPQDCTISLEATYWGLESAPSVTLSIEKEDGTFIKRYFHRGLSKEPVEIPLSFTSGKHWILVRTTGERFYPGTEVYNLRICNNTVRVY